MIDSNRAPVDRLGGFDFARFSAGHDEPSNIAVMRIAGLAYLPEHALRARLPERWRLRMTSRASRDVAVIWREDVDYCFLSIRGSELNALDWGRNLLAIGSRIDGLPRAWKFQTGYRLGVEGCFESVVFALREATRDGQSPKHLILTGHSQGGGWAPIMALLLGARWPRLFRSLQGVTVSPARSCNKAAAEAFPYRWLNYLNAPDVVPMLAQLLTHPGVTAVNSLLERRTLFDVSRARHAGEFGRAWVLGFVKHGPSLGLAFNELRDAHQWAEVIKAVQRFPTSPPGAGWPARESRPTGQAQWPSAHT